MIRERLVFNVWCFSVFSVWEIFFLSTWQLLNFPIRLNEFRDYKVWLFVFQHHSQMLLTLKQLNRSSRHRPTLLQGNRQKVRQKSPLVTIYRPHYILLHLTVTSWFRGMLKNILCYLTVISLESILFYLISISLNNILCNIISISLKNILCNNISISLKNTLCNLISISLNKTV